MTRSLRLLLHLCIAALLLIGTAFRARACCPHTYSANKDFSLINGNPNGVWGYGYSTTLGGTYISDAYAIASATPGVDFWCQNIYGTLTPAIFKNVTNSTISGSTVVLQPLQLLMHPGPNNEYSVIRFTAPNTGDFNFSTRFTGVDWIGTTTDVHVLKNGVVLWSSMVNGYQDTTATTGSVHLQSGDTLDVAVGPGANGNYFFDTTGVEFDIEDVTVCPFPFEGFLSPIGGADATGGSFASPLLSRKLGSTIPVKFKATTCCGDAVLTGVHTLQAIKYTSATASEPPVNATATDAATIGNQFRLTGNQWHFNLDTSFLSKGTWKLIATLSDGSTHTVWIKLN